MDRADRETSRLAENAADSPRSLRGYVTRLGLQGKLVLCFSLLLLIGLTMSFWFFASRSRETLSDILGEQARQIAQTLAMAAGPACDDQDVPQLYRLGRELLKSRNIVLVVFYDAAGEPVAVACRDPDMSINAWQKSPEPRATTQQLMLVRQRTMPSLGEYLQVTAPVLGIQHQPARPRNEGGVKLLGYLTVGISQNVEQAQLQRVSAMGIATGCLIFLISLPLASLLIHRVFLPIRQLAAAANCISRGQYEANVPTDRPDQIGQLARSFNKMVHRIRQHQQELKIANASLADANRGLEQKVLERTGELEASNRRLSAEIAEKEDFIRAVSHDLNAPLRNISGMASMLLLKCRDRFDEEIIHRLERIRKNVEVETDLIAELLELSRIKTRRHKMEPVALNDLVCDVAEMFEADLRQRGIGLSIETALPVLVCERSRIRQVFQNLIDNAIKYMGDGAEKRIEIAHQVMGDEVEFRVTDTGVGIESDDLAKVFYIFRRGRNSTAAGVPGKGVGLASVKSIVETYGGRIWAESEAGRGSTFRFTIPMKFAPTSESAAARAHEPAAAAH